MKLNHAVANVAPDRTFLRIAMSSDPNFSRPYAMRRIPSGAHHE